MPDYDPLVSVFARLDDHDAAIPGLLPHHCGQLPQQQLARSDSFRQSQSQKLNQRVAPPLLLRFALRERSGCVFGLA